MKLAKGYTCGDLVRHIYSGELGVVLNTRPVDMPYDPLMPHEIFDAYVFFYGNRKTWVPLEHIKKISN